MRWRAFELTPDGSPTPGASALSIGVPQNFRYQYQRVFRGGLELATAKQFEKVEYAELNGKQQEVHNFHQIAARLAQYGYATYPIRDDWNGGDMIARHMTHPKKPTLTIQVKG